MTNLLKTYLRLSVMQKIAFLGSIASIIGLVVVFLPTDRGTGNSSITTGKGPTIGNVTGSVGRDVNITITEPAKNPKPVYMKCRHPDFGRIGWQKSEDITNSSGWVSGGYDQLWWCNQVITGYVTSRKLGSNYEASVLHSWEEDDKDWKGHVTYKYHCQVIIKSIPLYAEKQDPRCGVVQ